MITQSRSRGEGDVIYLLAVIIYEGERETGSEIKRVR
jgi:hypothetical protein